MNKSNFKFQEIRREISKAAKNIFCRKWAEIKIKVHKKKNPKLSCDESKCSLIQPPRVINYS